jgi:hypothetical protein
VRKTRPGQRRFAHDEVAAREGLLPVFRLVTGVDRHEARRRLVESGLQIDTAIQRFYSVHSFPPKDRLRYRNTTQGRSPEALAEAATAVSTSGHTAAPSGKNDFGFNSYEGGMPQMDSRAWAKLTAEEKQSELDARIQWASTNALRSIACEHTRRVSTHHNAGKVHQATRESIHESLDSRPGAVAGSLGKALHPHLVLHIIEYVSASTMVALACTACSLYRAVENVARRSVQAQGGVWATSTTGDVRTLYLRQSQDRFHVIGGTVVFTGKEASDAVELAAAPVDRATSRSRSLAHRSSHGEDSVPIVLDGTYFIGSHEHVWMNKPLVLSMKTRIAIEMGFQLRDETSECIVAFSSQKKGVGALTIRVERSSTPRCRALPVTIEFCRNGGQRLNGDGAPCAHQFELPESNWRRGKSENMTVSLSHDSLVISGYKGRGGYRNGSWSRCSPFTFSSTQNAKGFQVVAAWLAAQNESMSRQGELNLNVGLYGRSNPAPITVMRARSKPILQPEVKGSSTDADTSGFWSF